MNRKRFTEEQIIRVLREQEQIRICDRATIDRGCPVVIFDGSRCFALSLPGSHQDHGAALANILSEAGVPTIAHTITDGRETPPQSAADNLKRYAAALPQVRSGRDHDRPLLRDGPRQALGPR